MKDIWLLSLISLTLCLTVTAQESVEISAFDESSPENCSPVAVQVETEYLKNISLSLLMAETWVRTHVLAYYPANNISTIVLGQAILCNKYQENKWGLISPAIKNIHYSLTRWGLQNDIKVSAHLDSNCLGPKSEKYIKSLLKTLLDISSPSIVMSDEKASSLLKSYFESMVVLGVLDSDKIKMMIIGSPRKQNTFSVRRLLDFDYNSLIDPFPPRPTPISPAISPLPPLIGLGSPAPSAPFLPDLAPMAAPFGPHLPPCNPSEGSGGGVGAPLPVRVYHGVWCVAKPSVPPEKLQEALDYACGEGGADCEAIRPQGSCYFPDTIVAHASYAFNSYWQKSKSHGGSCGFGGTAMLISSDPSYRQCRFVLA